MDVLPKWDPKQMYDISAAEKKALEERAQIRARMRAEFRKKITNPYRGTEGFVLDPAVQRFVSMRANHWDYFKATPRTFGYYFGTVWLPIIALSYLSIRWHNKREKKIRNGEIAYKDRLFKFMA